MVETWIQVLNKYSYPVKLNHYERSNQFPGFFNKKIDGNRNSTIAFENYFRKNASKAIEVYFEVIYWKLFSQPPRRNKTTSQIVDYVLEKGIKPEELHRSIQDFIENPIRHNLKLIRKYLGLQSNVLALPLTLVSFTQPEKYPMIDNVTAKWVNENYEKHNTYSQTKLTPFSRKYTSLQDNDFENYINWVNWCNEIADILTQRTQMHWRPRDVEMAVFTANRQGCKENVESLHIL